MIVTTDAPRRELTCVEVRNWFNGDIDPATQSIKADELCDHVDVCANCQVVMAGSKCGTENPTASR